MRVETTLLARCALPTPLFSENAYTGGAHWAARKARRHWRDTRDIWTLVLKSAEGLGPAIPQGETKRRVVIKRLLQRGQRKYDRSNLQGGSCKSVLDALKELGWLKDDNRRHLIDEYEELKYNEMNEQEYAEYVKGTVTIVEVHETEERIG